MIPHQGIINVKITGELYEQLPTGQVVIPRRKYRKSKLFTVKGDSLEDCEQKINTLIRKLINDNTET